MSPGFKNGSLNINRHAKDQFRFYIQWSRLKSTILCHFRQNQGKIPRFYEKNEELISRNYQHFGFSPVERALCLLKAFRRKKDFMQS